MHSPTPEPVTVNHRVHRAQADRCNRLVMVVGASTHVDTTGNITGVPDHTRLHHVLGVRPMINSDNAEPEDTYEPDQEPVLKPRYHVDKLGRDLSTKGKGVCQRCDERQPLDNLTLCFHTGTIHTGDHLKIVCLACRKDTRIWQPWSHKVPRCV